MMLEQEIASIMRFALQYAENPKPYYYDVQEGFEFPAMYFPQPEINTQGETFRTYRNEYVWYINVMCETTEEAHRKAFLVLDALKRGRNLVPLVDEQGEYTGEKLRLNDPSTKPIDTGVVQITLNWSSRRPYDAEAAEKMQYWEVEGWQNPDVYTTVEATSAIDTDIVSDTQDYPNPEYSTEA